LPEQVVGGYQQVSPPVVIEEVDVDREPTAESMREMVDDDQAISVKRPERTRPRWCSPRSCL
jgi:hypothetical protein